MRIFAATPRYIQGAGILSDLGKHTVRLGQQPFLIADSAVLTLLGKQMESAISSAGMSLGIAEFPGEITHAIITDLTEQARAHGTDVVIGVGGGKAIDAAKGVALSLGIRMISVPTIASNDGPASASIAVYDDQHLMVDVLQLKQNPDLVLVDSAIIAQAPLRFFLAGIGDAISKKFEAEACAKAGAKTLFGAQVSHTGMAVADACYRLIREHAQVAVTAVREQRVTPEVESVIEATVLLSTLSFENGGLSIAHAIARGYSHLPRAAGTLHGDHVAYGLLVQLVLEQREPAMLQELLTFYRDIGLPYRLAHFCKGEPDADEIQLLADSSMLSPSAARFTPKVDATQLAKAIVTVEKLEV
ncbi:MAG: glycerol dehydrogenase [Pseudomonadota bacterium]